jgi:hypothetical protein
MEAFTISDWQIWEQRNNFIFSRGQPSFLAWKTGFIDEARLQAHRISENKRVLFLSWNQISLLVFYFAGPTSPSL